MKNPFSWSRVAPYGRTHTHTGGGRTDGRTDRQKQADMTKRIVAFRNFANEPKKNGGRMEKFNKLTNQMY